MPAHRRARVLRRPYRATPGCRGKDWRRRPAPAIPRLNRWATSSAHSRAERYRRRIPSRKPTPPPCRHGCRPRSLRRRRAPPDRGSMRRCMRHGRFPDEARARSLRRVRAAASRSFPADRAGPDRWSGPRAGRRPRAASMRRRATTRLPTPEKNGGRASTQYARRHARVRRCRTRAASTRPRRQPRVRPRHPATHRATHRRFRRASRIRGRCPARSAHADGPRVRRPHRDATRRRARGRVRHQASFA